MRRYNTVASAITERTDGIRFDLPFLSPLESRPTNHHPIRGWQNDDGEREQSTKGVREIMGTLANPEHE